MLDQNTGTNKAERHLRIAMLGIRSIPTDVDSSFLSSVGCKVPRGLMGGAERAVERLSLELVSRGHHVTVYCRQGRRLTNDCNYMGIKLLGLPCFLSQGGEALSHTFIGILHASFVPSFFGGRPDLLHIHATGPALFAAIPRLFGIPTVVTVQGLDWKREKWGFLARQILKIGAWSSGKLSNATIVVSHFLEQHYLNRYLRKTHYIPNGVDLPVKVETGSVLEKLNITPKNYLLFLSRLVPEKNADLLIEAFKQVEGDFALIIAGEGSYTDDYVQLLNDMAKEDPRIHLVGGLYGKDKAEVFSNAGLFVLPSSVEGLSLALLEAMSYGIFPLVSDIAENAEVVLPAGGSVFKVGNLPDLVTQLRMLLSNLVALQHHSQYLRSYVESHYSWAEIAKKTEDVYLQLLEKKL